MNFLIFCPQVLECREVSPRLIIRWRVYRIRLYCHTRGVYQMHQVQYHFIRGQRVRSYRRSRVELHTSCRKLVPEDITAFQRTQHQRQHKHNRQRDSRFHKQAWEVLGTVKALTRRVAEPQVCSRSIHIKKKKKTGPSSCRTNKLFSMPFSLIESSNYAS